MKMWKRLAATLLVAALAMAMLTACGGEAAIVRDKDTEKAIAGMVQEYMKNKGYQVSVDTALEPVVDAAMPGMVNYWNAVIQGDAAEANKQAAQRNAAVQQKCNELRKTFAFTTRCGKGNVKQNNVDTFMEDARILDNLKKNGVDAPKSIAVGVTKQGDRIYIFIIATN